MSSWNFDSWDITDSYTYKTSKKAKRFLEEKLINDRRRSKSILQSTLHDVEEALDDAQRAVREGSQTVNKARNKVNADKNNYNYRYNYDYKYKYKNPYADQTIVTPPPKQQESTSTKQSKPDKIDVEKDMLGEDTIVKRKKSAVPFYIVSVLWIVCAFVMDLYSYKNLIILLVASVVLFLLSSLLFKGKKELVRVEKKVESTGDEKVDKLLEDGKKLIKQLHQASIDIENLKLSEQIRTLEDLCKKIFAFIAKYPQKASKIRKFMSYYIPTIIKLLNCYDMLEEQKIDGVNITSTMKTIEDNMETIVKAFKNQLDMMFEEEAMDISTDISVLEDMLEQEGLLDK